MPDLIAIRKQVSEVEKRLQASPLQPALWGFELGELKEQSGEQRSKHWENIATNLWTER